MATNQRSIAEEQKRMAKAVRKTKCLTQCVRAWSVDDEIDFHSNPRVKSSVSRNKREGQYAGHSSHEGKHHRIYHHKKPAGFKSVGTKLLLAIF